MADKQLVEMIMSGGGAGADLRSADLTYAKLQGANLRGADLYQANLKGADLADADLYDADLYDANLQGAYLEGANLEGVNLAVADLWGANLWGADLWGANLQGAKLQGAILTRANFTGANLEGVNLSLADLIHAKLQGANLKGAYFQYANLTNANLQDADLNGADLTNAKKIENAILKGVKYDSNTVWPRGFTPPGDGSGRMASRASKKASGDPLLLNVNIDPRLLKQNAIYDITGYHDIEDLLSDYRKGRVGERQEIDGIGLDYAGAGLDLEGCFKVPKKLSKELLIYFTKSMNDSIEYATDEGAYIDEDTIKVHSYGYEHPDEVTYELIPVEDSDIQTDEYEEEGELGLIGKITSFRAITANVIDTMPSWSKDYLYNRPKSLYIVGTCEIAYEEGVPYEVIFQQNFDYIDYPDRKYDLNAYAAITPGVIKTMYCVELFYEDLVKLRKMGKIASRNRKASTMVPIKISSVSHKEKFPFNADDFRRNPDESLRRAANRFLESVKNEILYCTVYVDGEMHTTVPITVGSFDTTKIVSKLQNSFSRLGSRIPDQGKGTITFDFKFVPFSGKSEMLVDVDEMVSDDMLNLMAKSDITLDVSIKTIYGDVWSMSVEDSPVAYFDLEINVPEILPY